ncbi:hypothetical protein [Spirosoma utsteinense]|uniref:Uncharacterized protein n=1 Tax=Spirosoma utsteinense TaxID=2585773 RepID=A0ABR6WDY6_9BACT|nr:hypothetical protein [Spirosoma utsteinense]MBC3788309.1 hypothetical protein [Spirosoma utsteinense]MBC3794215.1 hypothetical protein [Spirosoma utsteinense]
MGACTGLGVCKGLQTVEGNKPCPAVRTLTQVLLDNVSLLTETYVEVNGKPLPRLQWKKDGTLNRHDAGLALDLILFADRASEQQLANEIIEAFLECRPEMQWYSVIYMNFQYDRHGNRSPYTESDLHRTHIHIDWLNYSLYEQTGKTSIPWPPEAYRTGFTDILTERLNRTYSQW